MTDDTRPPWFARIDLSRLLSALRGPLHRQVPVRRSTLALLILFVGLFVLYRHEAPNFPPDNASGSSGGAGNGTPAVTYHVAPTHDRNETTTTTAGNGGGRSGETTTTATAPGTSTPAGHRGHAPTTTTPATAPPPGGTGSATTSATTSTVPGAGPTSTTTGTPPARRSGATTTTVATSPPSTAPSESTAP